MIGLDLFVVLYRRQITKSETLSSIRRLDFSELGFSVTVHIWDNSPGPAEPDQLSLPQNWNYFHDPQNSSLSKVYNTLFRQSTRPYVMILDQDSELSVDLFSKLHDSIAHVPADIFAPVIMHSGAVISPGKLLWIKGSRIRHLHRNALLPKNFTAMMSGLCINRSYLASLSDSPFDERLRFYGIDTKFCRDACARRAKAYVYDALLPHDSALRSTGNRSDHIERYIWLWQSWLHVFDRNIPEVIAIRLYIAFKLILVSKTNNKYTLRELFAKVYR